MSAKTEKLLSVLKLQPVVPVLIIEDVAHAVPLARALVAGGLKAIEITMRTAAALDAIKAVATRLRVPLPVPARSSTPGISSRRLLPVRSSSSAPAQRADFSMRRAKATFRFCPAPSRPARS